MKLAMKLLLFLVVVLFLVGSASAATYYVATDGNNSDPGTVGEPWLTMTYAESQLSDGDTVIVRGGTYHERFTINVPNVTFQNYTGEFPVIDGQWDIPVADDVYTSYEALVEIIEYGVTFDGFEICNSTGTGIKVWGAGHDDAYLHNLVVHDVYRYCLQLSHDADSTLVEDCEFYSGAGVLQFCDYNPSSCRTLGYGDPATITTPTVTNTIFRRIKVHDSHNEGINFERQSNGTLIEYSEIYSNTRGQMYLVSSTNHTVRYCLIYGTELNIHGKSSRLKNGIGMAHEEQWIEEMGNPVIANYKIYGNLIANVGGGLNTGGTTNNSLQNIYAYNNIIVYTNTYGIVISNNVGQNSTYKNNIIWAPDAQISNVPPGRTFDYNLWSRTPDADSQGTNDPTYAVPQILKSTGWPNLTGGELNGSEFTLNSTSPAIDNGTDIGSPYNMGVASVSTWVDDISLLDQDDYGTGWEIGAFVYGTAAAGESAPTTSDFTYYKIITINQTMVNQSIGTGIYPLLVSTTDTDLRDHCQADGDDIVFFDADNTTLLPYEQEFWNSTNGELVEHVGVTDPTNVTHIVMYYNNSTIANSENATGVWDSNFVVVQHLNETPAGTTYDSTSNNNDGTTVGMDSADQVAGQVDGSLDFDGIDDRISLTSPAIDNNAAFTISTWMYGEPDSIVYGEGYSVNTQWALFLGVEANSPYSARFYYKENNVWKALTTGTTQVNDTWHHVVLSQASKSSRTMYIDGVAEETDTDAVGDMSILDTANIGVLQRSDFASYFVGEIDELRISDIARSAEWIETEYNNTAYPTLFISIGAEQGEGAADTKFEYWTGSAWVDDEAQYYLWFTCFWHTAECANAEQSGSQATLKISNNGTASGTPKMKLNESAPAGIEIFVDDDNTFAGAVELTNTYQAVSTSLNQDTNITLWAWANLSGAPSWEFETYAIVE